MTQDFPQLKHVLGPMKPKKPRSNPKRCSKLTLHNLEKNLSSFLPAAALDGSLGDHKRNRLFPMERTFWSWLWQVFQFNTACREVVRQLQILLGLSGLTCDEGSSAYCQSRAKISMQLLKALISLTARAAAEKAAKRTILQARPLKTLDGSSARLPDLPEVKAKYPQPTSQKEGAGFPVIKFCAFFCVQTGAILAHATGNLFSAEISLAGRLLKHLKKGDILVTDRGFCNYVFLWILQRLGVDLIVRVPSLVRHIDFRKAKTLLGPKDGLFEWKKPLRCPKWVSLAVWSRVPDTILVRVIHFTIPNKKARVRSVILATTLLDPKEYPANEIGQAFGLRWREEMCFDDIKTTMQMANLKCKSPDMLEKELAMFLIAHNFIRCLMLNGAKQSGWEV
jgi:hypothetical protein